jgi:hypothetical protein
MIWEDVAAFSCLLFKDFAQHNLTMTIIPKNVCHVVHDLMLDTEVDRYY